MEQSEKKTIIAAFDFDGTITTKDTLFDFIAFYHGKTRLILGLCILSPILVAHKVGFVKNYIAKQILFSYFFKNKLIHEFDSIGEKYAHRVDCICRTSTLSRLKEHQNNGDTVIIISASITNWIKPWAKEKGIEAVLGTEIEVDLEGKITGKFRSNNCYGQEKVNRLLEIFPKRTQYILYAYGDSRGDKELLALADYSTLIKE
ncbi:MAG: hypothetical protein RL662_2072 [Bacteroidota bacterium]|jgi:HAD superfamily hydrolase (TIGR01490 family)